MQFDMTSLFITYCGDFNDKMVLRSPYEINTHHWEPKLMPILLTLVRLTVYLKTLICH